MQNQNKDTNINQKIWELKPDFAKNVIFWFYSDDVTSNFEVYYQGNSFCVEFQINKHEYFENSFNVFVIIRNSETHRVKSVYERLNCFSEEIAIGFGIFYINEKLS